MAASGRWSEESRYGWLANGGDLDRLPTLRRVRATVEDSGGKWSRDMRRVTRLKARSVLRGEDPVRLVLQYHATDAAENWATDLPADEALRYAVRRAASAVGVRIQTMATLGALSLLVEMSAGGVPGLLSPEVVENIKARG